MARQAYLYSTSLVLRWMIRLNIGVLLLLFAASPIVVPIFFNIARAAGNTYYVDNCVNTGSDSYDGTEQTHTTGNTGPWLTINKVNTSTFSAGDSVLFQKTCTWRWSLTVPSSGSAGSPITFGAYGSGAHPLFNAANVLTGFSLYSGSIYSLAVADVTNQVFQDNARLIKKTSTGAMIAGSFYWNGSTTLYVWMTDSANPSTHTVEGSYWYQGITFNGQSYVNIDSIDVTKANQSGYEWGSVVGTNHANVTNAVASWNGQNRRGFFVFLSALRRTSRLTVGTDFAVSKLSIVEIA